MTNLTVNDQPLEFKLDPQMPLAWALRDAANLTGTKVGCGAGDCGTCMVLVDGTAIQSCQVSMAEMEGRAITTIEGLANKGFGAVFEAIEKVQATQCGYCTPGFAMSIAALLARNAGPIDDEIRAAIPNLCRCGCYPRLIDAVHQAGMMLRRGASIVPSAATRAPLVAETVPGEPTKETEQ